VDTILDKKGSDVLLLDIRDQATFTDYFLICNADNERQLAALAEGISESAKKNGSAVAWGKEGQPDGGWVLLDYGDLVVHLFSPQMRRYYGLEELWTGAHVVLRMQ
jgi:ribosome-associated protein